MHSHRVTSTGSRWAARWLRGVLAIWLLGVAACKEDDWVCALVPGRGVELTVLDGLSGANLEALALVTVGRLAPNFDRTAGPPSHVGGLTQLPGTYELRIEATGYAARTDTATVASRRVNGCEETVTQNRVVQLTPNQ